MSFSTEIISREPEMKSQKLDGVATVPEGVGDAVGVPNAAEMPPSAVVSQVRSSAETPSSAVVSEMPEAISGANTTDVPETVMTDPGAGTSERAPEEPRHWFVAIVGHNTEKACAERLKTAGYECYLPTQEETRVWKNGRRAKIERVVLPTIIFIKCTERERREVVKQPYIKRFMTNRAGTLVNDLHKPVAIIPDRQIDTLRFMVGNSNNPVTIVSTYRKGDKVRVIRGSLRGLEGEIVRTPDGKEHLTVGIDFLGYARIEIDRLDVEPIKKLN